MKTLIRCLTPIFLLAIPGLFLLWLGANYRLRDLAIMTTLFDIAFYSGRGEKRTGRLVPVVRD